MYVRQLAFNWIKKSTAEATRASVRLQIESFVDGDLEHASEVLSILLEMASSDEDIVAPVNIGADVSSFSFPFCPSTGKERLPHASVPRDLADPDLSMAFSFNQDSAHKIDSQRFIL